MRPLIFALALASAATASIALAAAPTFTVKCMHTGGKTSLAKYGMYYFFLPDGQVKGYACGIPGRPCQIVSKSATTIVFQTPGENPDTLTLDLRNGAISYAGASGDQATFACRQVPNEP